MQEGTSRSQSNGSENGGRGRSEAVEAEEGQRQFATFYLDEQFFGIDVLRVQEILKVRGITPVPLAPPVIAGLINLRGQIVLALDLRTRLGIRSRSTHEQETSVVVKSGDVLMNLLVDRIGDVIQIDSNFLEEPPETLSDRFKEVTEGVYKMKDQLLLLLDIDAVTAVS